MKKNTVKPAGPGWLQRLGRRPRGRIPSATKAWLAANEQDCGWQIAVCGCGGWYHKMDRLAPYHTEMNWCPKCDTIMAGMDQTPTVEVSHRADNQGGES